MDFSNEDREALAAAVRRLETPSLAGRFAALAGKPAGLVQRALPAAASVVVARAAKHALEHALDVALFSLRNRRLTGGRKLHSGLACTSGAIGGAFGLVALTIELPVSTTIMLRAIAAIIVLTALSNLLLKANPPQWGTIHSRKMTARRFPRHEREWQDAHAKREEKMARERAPTALTPPVLSEYGAGPLAHMPLFHSRSDATR